MNLVESAVLEIKSKPYFNYLWCVDVVATSYGHECSTIVYFMTEEAANELRVGSTFES